MKLRNIALGIATLTLSLMPSMMHAQVVESANLKAANLNNTNYRVGLAHKVKLTDADIKAMGEKCTPYGLPTIKQTIEAVKANKTALSKSRAAGVTTKSIRAASYVASDTVYWESFESWDGSTFDYLPDGWVEFVKSESAINATYGYNPTWGTYQSDGYNSPYATDGSYVAMISHSYDLYDENETLVQEATEQDEWLVSDKIEYVQASHYLSFDLGYSPVSMHYFPNGDDYDIDFDKKSFDLEILVGANLRRPSNNVDDYVSVFKLSDVIAEEIAEVGTDEASVSRLMAFTWHSFNVSLKDFADDDIYVAFRYTGINGGTVLLDAVRVSDLLPVAKYAVPEGAFFYGFSEEHYVVGQQQASAVLLPADRESVWKNMSNTDSRTYQWAYYQDDDTETPTGLSTEESLVLPAHNASDLRLMPVLTATGEDRSNEFTKTGVFKYGGNTAMTYSDVGNVLHGAGNYDLTKGHWTAPLESNSNSSLFGTGSSSFWTQYDSNLTGKVTGVANWYETPASPYIISRVWLPLTRFTSMGNSILFNCTIYKCTINEQGVVEVTDEVIANTSTTSGNVKNNKLADGTFNMVFDFEEPVVIDQPVLIYIDGFQNANGISPVAQALGHDSGINYALISLETKNKSYVMWPLENIITNADGVGNAATSFCISTNAVFPYLYSKEGYTFEIADAGGEKSFECDTYFAPDAWTVEGVPTWATMEKIVDEAANTVKVKFTAEALPAGEAGRSANVKITSNCNDITFTLLQGEAITGIEGVDAAKTVKVRMADNTLQLDYTADVTSVAIYNAAGTLVKSASLPASGSATLDASELGRGTYIVRFGGKTHPVVKVVK